MLLEANSCSVRFQLKICLFLETGKTVMQLFHRPNSSFPVKQHIQPLHAVPDSGANLEPTKPERISHGL